MAMVEKEIVAELQNLLGANPTSANVSSILLAFCRLLNINSLDNLHPEHSTLFHQFVSSISRLSPVKLTELTIQILSNSPSNFNYWCYFKIYEERIQNYSNSNSTTETIKVDDFLIKLREELIIPESFTETETSEFDTTLTAQRKKFNERGLIILRWLNCFLRFLVIEDVCERLRKPAVAGLISICASFQYVPGLKWSNEEISDLVPEIMNQISILSRTHSNSTDIITNQQILIEKYLDVIFNTEIRPFFTPKSKIPNNTNDDDETNTINEQNTPGTINGLIKRTDSLTLNNPSRDLFRVMGDYNLESVDGVFISDTKETKKVKIIELDADDDKVTRKKSENVALETDVRGPEFLIEKSFVKEQVISKVLDKRIVVSTQDSVVHNDEDDSNIGNVPEWKKRLECIRILRFLINNVAPNLQQHYYYFIPAIVTLLSDWEIPYKTFGIELVEILLQNIKNFKELEQNGILDLLVNSLLPLFTYNQEIPLLEKSISLSHALSLKYQPSVEKPYFILTKLLGKFPYYVGGSISSVLVVLKQLQVVLPTSGIQGVGETKTMLEFLCRCLEIYEDGRVELEGAKSLQVVIRHCWGRIKERRGMVLKGLMMVWVKCSEREADAKSRVDKYIPGLDDGEEGVERKKRFRKEIEDAVMIKKEVKETLRLLKIVCGSVIETDLNTLQMLDSDMFAQFK